TGYEEPEEPEEPDITVLADWSELPASSLVLPTDAILAMRTDLWGASALDVERGGIELYTSSGVMLGSYEEILNLNSVDTFVISQYECVSQIGVELYPGVSYVYRMYIDIAGGRYYSYFCSFTAALPETGPDYLVGDMDNNGTVDSDDAIFLLRHTLFSDDFLIYQPADFDGDGGVSSSDAVLLLNYVLFPGDYQLNGQ
ncbi:MAG: dockerin type I repeat-containing protein, partial [Clostridia bacterium]|nr:dockerin type I repeat-containing protein [Clostridia bacterium]